VSAVTAQIMRNRPTPRRTGRSELPHSFVQGDRNHERDETQQTYRHETYQTDCETSGSQEITPSKRHRRSETAPDEVAAVVITETEQPEGFER
jgi:hypothetical protein